MFLFLLVLFFFGSDQCSFLKCLKRFRVFGDTEVSFLNVTVVHLSPHDSSLVCWSMRRSKSPIMKKKQMSKQRSIGYCGHWTSLLLWIASCFNPLGSLDGSPEVTKKSTKSMFDIIMKAWLKKVSRLMSFKLLPSVLLHRSVLLLLYCQYFQNESQVSKDTPKQSNEIDET